MRKPSKIMKKEDGMLIVEATIVFPVMFLVILFLYYLGNAYYQTSRVDAVVSQMAYYGAAQCSDPLLDEVQTSGKVPPFTYKYEIQPYRYMLGEAGEKAGMSSIESTVKTKIRSVIEKADTGLFSGMKPKIDSLTAEFNNAFVYTTFFVQVDYTVPFPMRLLGMDESLSMKCAALCEVPVSDTPEFIRVIDMAEDWFFRWEKAGEITEKIGDAMEKVFSFLN